MDEFCPIYPFQQHDEDQLGFQNPIPTFEIPQQQYIIEENFVTNHALASSFDVGSFLDYNSVVHGIEEFHQSTFLDSNLDENKRQQISATSASRNTDFGSNENKQKKMIHKEIERQRRHQMVNLYSSLKSLLPLESSKGRQSTSDLIHEAENHIRLKQKNIEELTIKRDNLKKCLSKNENNNLNSSTDETSSSLPCSHFPVDISVKSHLGGMEIFINTDIKMDGFQLSRVLELILGEGLCVVCCACTRIHGKILHTIQTEVSHQGVTDAQDLKQKLFAIVNHVPNFEKL